MQILPDLKNLMTKYKEGMNLYYQGEHEKAAELFIQLLSEDPNHHKAWNALGVCLKRLGDLKQAEECFSNAIHLAPDNSIYARNLKFVLDDDIANPSDENDSNEKRGDGKRKKRSLQPDQSDIVCLFLGLLLIGVYLYSLMIGSIIVSPTREFIGLGGILFFFFFVSANFLKIFASFKVPLRFILFVCLIIALIILFVKFIIDQHGIQ